VDRSRLESFSDGVFAVAATLLVVNLAVPRHGGPPILDQLAAAWPSFVAYLVSFFTIGIIWVNHHALIQNVAVVNRTLLFLNLLLLVFVVTIPFSTATMASFLTGGSQNAKVAAALYALDFEIMSLCFMALFEWTLREDSRLHEPVPEEARWPARRRFYAGQLPYAGAIGLAFASPAASLAVTGLVAVYYVFERTPGPRPDH
jgi:TMEM175 potassium channel family protein